jgi:acid phosphatase (class A)
MSGDPRFQTDIAIFHATRSLEGSARWRLAQSDDNLSLAGLLYAFRCALGLTLTPDDAPKLTVLLTRANSDAYFGDQRDQDPIPTQASVPGRRR